MIFIETEVFTNGVRELLSEEEYQQFQLHLALQPACGDVIPDTGGLRKVRWVAKGRGKRAGVRVIYCYRRDMYQILLLIIYRKGIKDDLSAQEKMVLRKLSERW